MQHHVTKRNALLTMMAAWLSGALALAQTPPPDEPAAPAAPAATDPAAPAATDPAALPPGAQDVMAKVIDVVGDVKYAPLGSEEWKPVALNEEYPPRTKIRTGLRSSVKLQIGQEEPLTAVLIDSAGKTVIAEAMKTADTKRVRLDLLYGSMRAGVAEGGLKSDFTVDTPVATLSKRGTWNFGMSFERSTDRFEIFLLDHGLVEVLNKFTRESRTASPGERVTQALRFFLDQAQFKNVPIADLLGQGDIEVAFNRLQNDGLGVISPGSGRATIINLSSPAARTSFQQLAQQALITPTGTPPPVTPGAVVRPEGFFGSGRGDDLVQVIVDETNPLAKGGFARPGNYRFRRAAIESWLQQNRR